MRILEESKLIHMLPCLVAKIYLHIYTPRTMSVGLRPLLIHRIIHIIHQPWGVSYAKVVIAH